MYTYINENTEYLFNVELLRVLKLSSISPTASKIVLQKLSPPYLWFGVTFFFFFLIWLQAASSDDLQLGLCSVLWRFKRSCYFYWVIWHQQVRLPFSVPKHCTYMYYIIGSQSLNVPKSWQHMQSVSTWLRKLKYFRILPWTYFGLWA